MIQVEIEGFDQPIEFEDGTDPTIIQRKVKELITGRDQETGAKIGTITEETFTRGLKEFALEEAPAVVGGIATGLAAAATGPIGVLPLVGYVALGAGGGEAIKQLGQYLSGSLGAPKTSIEAAKRISAKGIEEGAWEAFGGFAMKGIRKIITPFRKTVTEGVDEAAEIFKDKLKPVVLLPAEATESRTLDMVQNVAESSIIGGNKIAEFKTNRIKFFDDFADSVIDQFGERTDPSDLGNLFVAAIEKKRKVHGEISKILYNNVSEVVKGAAPVMVPTKSLKDFVRPMRKVAEELGSIEAKNAGDDLIAAIEDLPDSISFDTARELRSRLIARVDEFSVINKKAPAIGKAKKMISLTDSAIEDSLKAFDRSGIAAPTGARATKGSVISLGDARADKEITDTVDAAAESWAYYFNASTSDQKDKMTAVELRTMRDKAEDLLEELGEIYRKNKQIIGERLSTEGRKGVKRAHNRAASAWDDFAERWRDVRDGDPEMLQMEKDKRGAQKLSKEAARISKRYGYSAGEKQALAADINQDTGWDIAIQHKVSAKISEVWRPYDMAGRIAPTGDAEIVPVLRYKGKYLKGGIHGEALANATDEFPELEKYFREGAELFPAKDVGWLVNNKFFNSIEEATREASRGAGRAGPRRVGGAYDKWRIANRFYRESQAKFNNVMLRRLVKMAEDTGTGAEMIAPAVFRPGQVSKVRKVKMALDPPTWRKMKGFFMQHLLQKSTDVDGIIKGKRLINSISGKPGSFGMPMLKEVLSEAQIDSLQKFAKVLEASQVRQAEGAGKVLIQLSQAGAMGMIVAGKLELPSAAIIFGPALLSRMMLIPATARWLTKGVALPANSEAAAGLLARLIAASNRIHRDMERENE